MATQEEAAQFLLQLQHIDNPQNISLQMHFKLAVRNFHASNTSRWFPQECWEVAIVVGWWAGQFPLIQLVFNTKATSHNHCLSSLSATRVTTLWLKQLTVSICDCCLLIDIAKLLGQKFYHDFARNRFFSPSSFWSERTINLEGFSCSVYPTTGSSRGRPFPNPVNTDVIHVVYAPSSYPPLSHTASNQKLDSAWEGLEMRSSHICLSVYMQYHQDQFQT